MTDKKEGAVNDNMRIWEKVKQPPPEVLKPIPGGADLTNICPQWRYKVATEMFGPCGVGWMYTIDRLWLEPTDADVAAFALVSLRVKIDGEWTNPIPGIGGSKFVALRAKGLNVNDEAYKMAVTDALSVAFKVLGVGADVYMDRWDGSKYDVPEEEDSVFTDWILACREAAESMDREAFKTWWPENKPAVIKSLGEGKAARVYSEFTRLLKEKK